MIDSLRPCKFCGRASFGTCCSVQCQNYYGEQLATLRRWETELMMLSAEERRKIREKRRAEIRQAVEEANRGTK